MSEFGALAAYLRDPRLTAHATSAMPAWLWSPDASRLLWANPVGAAVFDAPSPAALAGSTIDPKGTAALQIARLAATLSHGAAPRLERLRGFGGRFGRALMCACTRITLANRNPAILVVATEPAGPGLTLAERVRRLLIGIDEPLAIFGGDGGLLDATAAGQEQLRGLRTLAALGVEGLAGKAAAGQVKGQSHVGAVSIERVGSDTATVLMVAFAEPEPAKPVAPAVTAPSEAPAAAMPPLEPRSPPATAVVSAPAVEAPPVRRTPSPERRQPLRFGWQMDAEGHFTLGSDEFIALIGPQTADALKRSWNEAASALAIDPAGQVAPAISSRDTWSGITVSFPVEGTPGRLAVELSGLPVFDRDRNFLGYRGFGICRDATRIAALMELRREALAAAPVPPVVESKTEPKSESRHEPPVLREERPMLSVVPPSENVVPFRASTPPEKQPSLTPVERKAFRELASRLTERLRTVDGETPVASPPQGEAAVTEPAPPAPGAELPSAEAATTETAAREASSDTQSILDRLPVGVLVYRLDRLIYANRAFLDWTGYETLQAVTDGGGLDALFVEPSSTALTERNGSRPLSIATKGGAALSVDARLFSSPWDGESALVLMITRIGEEKQPPEADDTALRNARAEAQELNAILDAATDAILVLNRQGHVVALNQTANAMFGYESREMIGLAAMSLLAPESQRIATDYPDSAQP